MINNNILNQIIKDVQHRNFLPGEKYLSIKQLMIKHNASASKVRASLNAAEKIGLIKLRKGFGGVVTDFSKNIYLSNYSLKGNYTRKWEDVTESSDDMKAIFDKNNLSYKKMMKMTTFDGDNIVSKFYVEINIEDFKGYIKRNIDIMDILKLENVVITRIDEFVKQKKIDGENYIVVYRNLYNKDRVFERAVLLVNPSYFYFKNITNYPYSDL